LRIGALLAVCSLVAMTIGIRPGPSGVFAQEASPVALPSAPESREEVIAQGLAIFDVNPAIWRVVELRPALFDEAESVTGDVSFTLQISGVTVIRNEVTLKRARLEPGEGYFMSAEDGYLRYALEDNGSVAWSIEYVSPDASDEDAGGDVIYKSEAIDQFPAGTRDLELIRNVLLPGESSALPSHNSPVLVLATTGQVELSAGPDASVTLSPGDGLVLPGDANVINNGDEAASYVVVVVGARVPDPGETLSSGDEEEAPADETAAPSETETPEPTATATATSAPDRDEDGLSDSEEATVGTDPTKADTDGDGTSDGDEVYIYGTDPLDSSSHP
jgi:hypothetical protein